MEELCSALLLVAEMWAAPVTECCCVFFFVCLFLSEARCVEKQESLQWEEGEGGIFI